MFLRAALSQTFDLQRDHETYKTCSYTSCEISPVLARQQRERVASQGGHASQFKVENRDAADCESWGSSKLDPCFILGMEVLDNCAHDKYVLSGFPSWSIGKSLYITANCQILIQCVYCWSISSLGTCLIQAMQPIPSCLLLYRGIHHT